MTDTPTGAAEIYDAFAEKYRAYSDGKAAYIAAVDGLIRDRFAGKTETLLDYGAGDGVRGAALFRDLGARALYQTDISPEMVARCRANGAATDVFNVTYGDWATRMPGADLAVCQWNVLGHVPGTEARIGVLRDIHRAMAPGAALCIDVNNRHYVGYGRWRSMGRRIIDAVRPDYARGDVQFTWKIDGRDYPASGHFFTPAEMRDLLAQGGFDVAKALSVDYANGTVSSDLTQGQLFFVASRR